MKSALLVFCAYLFLLSVLPCHDSVECSENRAEQFSGKHDHTSHNELCPPFCTCACCGVQIAQLLPPGFMATAFQPEIFSKNASFYTSAFPTGIAFAIWQPPKIS